MKVKCPKCRLRFDVPAAVGVNEVQCNCPRCGTPFTYSVTADDGGQENNVSRNEAVAAKETAATNGSGNSSNVKETASVKAEAGNGSSQEGVDRLLAYGNSLYGHRHGMSERGFAPHTHSGMRHTVTIALGIVGVLAVAGLFVFGIDRIVGHFTDRDEAIMEDLAVVVDTAAQDSTAADSAKAMKKAIKAKVAANKKEKAFAQVGKRQGKPAVEAVHGSVPKWAQGVWHIMTDNNYISIRINGSRIKVSDFYHTNQGSISVQGNSLVCHFKDGRTFVYTLDTNGHRIIDGHGTVLQR